MKYRSINCLIYFFLFAGTSVFATNFKSDLVAYYPFDGNASDMSGNGNNGTVYGASLGTDRHGQADMAYQFDGINDWIGLSQQIPDLVNFTLSVWFNGTGSIFQDETESSGNDFGIYYHGTDGTFRIRNTKGGSPFNESYSPSLFLNNSWNNVIFSLSSNKVIVAFNGNKREYVGTYTGNVGYHASTPRIGAYNYFGNSNFFNGSIDEIRLYRRAITSDEVTALYELGKPLIEQNVSQSRAENVGQGDPMTDYDKSKTYSLGALVLVGQNSYIATRAVPVNTNPLSAEYWTNLSVAATALKVPVETVANLSTSTILNSLPNSASEPETSSPKEVIPKDYSYLSRSTERREYKNTATIMIYSPLIDYSIVYAVEGLELLDYQISDIGFTSGKVRTNGKARVEGIDVTFNGEMESPYLQPLGEYDSDGNGIPDFYEVNKMISWPLKGAANYSYQGYGSFSAILDIYLYRGGLGPGSRFQLSENVTIQNSTIPELPSGSTLRIGPIFFTPIHATGEITVNPSTGTYSCNIDYHGDGPTGSSSSSGSYSVGVDSRISFSSLPFPSMNNSAYANTLPALGRKNLWGDATLPYKGSGNFYGMVNVEGIPYFVSITDPNDLDGNGRPNILDDKREMKSFSQVSDVGNGWLKSDWLGYYWINPSWQTSSSDLLNYVAGHANDTFHSWVFHSVFGWIYISSGKYEVTGIGNGFSAWIYFQDEGWRYTDGLLFPFLYNSKTSSWLYYNSSSSKALYDYSSSEWKSIDPL